MQRLLVGLLQCRRSELSVPSVLPCTRPPPCIATLCADPPPYAYAQISPQQSVSDQLAFLASASQGRDNGRFVDNLGKTMNW